MRTMVLMLGIVFLCLGCSKNDGMKFSGTVEMTEHVLGAKVAGRVMSITVKEGDLVKAGQVLVSLDRYEQAKRDYERAQELLKSGGANAQAVEYAQLNMQDQQVVSSLDGIVLVKAVESGETVGAGAGVVVVGDPKDQWVRIFVPEGVINRLNLNQEAKISLDGMNRAYKGHVSFIATKAEFTPRNVQTSEERVTQAFEVKVALDEINTVLHPGVPADITFSN